MSIERLNHLIINDKDIEWIETIMGGHIHFDDCHKSVLANLNSVDIQAFPGSGKTTTLVAKLAILSNKWTCSHSGICVLSHTNVAREEIEKRLGNTDAGRKLLLYPHYIGTLHSFFDTFVAIPWLRSNGIKISMIDTDIVKAMRWYELDQSTRKYLERQHCDKQICGYSKSWQSIDWNKQGKTKNEIIGVITQSQNNGYFTFDEMLLLSKKILSEYPTFSRGIQERFPILFIDEAQDTNTLLWELLQLAFPDESLTIRQGFGDSNQAIYSYVNESVDTIGFPRNSHLVLANSKRFDDRIASFANSVAISKSQMNGTDNSFSNKKIPHTIFLFDPDSASQVIVEFANLILESFSDDELNANKELGCHVIGMIHNKTGETPTQQFPKGIYDYWPNYDARKTNKSATPQKLINHFQRAKNELNKSGELFDCVAEISKGLRRVINLAAESNLVPASGNTFFSIMKLLTQEKIASYRKLMLELAQADISTKDLWTQTTTRIADLLTMLNLSRNSKVDTFIEWVADCAFTSSSGSSNHKIPNHYLHVNQESKREVDLEFGSIHSVKGRTHLATLVLETFSRTHNIKAILPYLCGAKINKINDTTANRLKCQYVAMSRATALLCLAIPADSVSDDQCKMLIDNGWNIKMITQR